MLVEPWLWRYVRTRLARSFSPAQIPNMTPSAERPAEVATRTVPGHWEGDLIKEARNGLAVGSFVERMSRLVLLVRLEGTDARLHWLVHSIEDKEIDGSWLLLHDTVAREAREMHDEREWRDGRDG